MNDSSESSRRADKSRLSKLARVLLIKAACDLISVVALAGAFFFTTFTPWLSGRVEVADGYVSGHISMRNRGDTIFDVQLFVDGKFVAHKLTQCAPAPDLAATSAANEGCEFRFELPEVESGEHEVRVYISDVTKGSMRRVLHLLGEPQPFVKES